MKDLLYLQEHVSCVHYFNEKVLLFKFYEFEDSECLISLERGYHHILFVLSGDIRVNCDEFMERHLRAGQSVLIPKSAEFSSEVISKCKLVIFTFDHFLTLCDKLSFLTLSEIKEKIDYGFKPVKIHQPLNDFFDLLSYYLKSGIKCDHLYDLKSQELFLIFRAYYTKEELALLFYPIIGKTLDFKGSILKKYRDVENVNELATLFNMSRANFDIKFKHEFGMPPYQWLLKQKAKHVKYDLSDPEITLSDVMNKYNFNSSTHFYRFCKQQFGCNPTELVKKLRIH